MLSIEKLNEIETAAIETKSFNGLKSLISAYRSVARAAARITKEEQEKREQLYELQKNSREKAKKKIAKAVDKIRAVNVEFQVEDPTVASKCIKITLDNMGELLEFHAEGSKLKKTPYRSEFTVPGETEKVGAPPSSYPRWSRMKIFSRAFFVETLALLDQSIGVSNTEVNSDILAFLSNPSNLKWVIPFGRLSERILSHLCRLWTSPVNTVRLRAFLAIRAFVAVAGIPSHTSESAMKGSKKGEDSDDDDDDNSDDDESGIAKSDSKSRLVGVARVDAVLNKMYRVLILSSSKCQTWRGTSAIRFGINCLAELLRMNSGVAYRICFNGVRQLALLTRQACLPNPPKLTEKQKRHAPDGAVLTWAYVSGCRIWTNVILSTLNENKNSKLSELVFPLATIISSALKLKMANAEYAPFCLHLLNQLNYLSTCANVHIPTIGYANTLLIHAANALSKARRSANNGANDAANASKKNAASRLQRGVADVELLIKLKTEHMNSLQVLETACDRILDNIQQSLSLMAGHPGFPEASLPISAMLRKSGKSLENDYLRRKVKELVATIEEECEDMKNSGVRDTLKVNFSADGVQLRIPLMLLETSSSSTLRKKSKSIEELKSKRLQEGVEAEEQQLVLEARALAISSKKGEVVKSKKEKKEQMKGILSDARETGRQAKSDRLAKGGANGVKRGKKFTKFQHANKRARTA